MKAVRGQITCVISQKFTVQLFVKIDENKNLIIYRFLVHVQKSCKIKRFWLEHF